MREVPPPTSTPFPSGTSEVRPRPLGIAIAVTLGFAILGQLLVGEVPEEWYQGLVRPGFEAPVGIFLAMSVAYYLLLGAVLYRIQVHVPPPEARVAFGLALGVMALNAVWNAVFVNLRSPFLGFVGILVLFGALFWLWTIAYRRDRPSFWILAPYVAWVLYDLVWSFELWRLN